jgi:hypothetical protein
MGSPAAAKLATGTTRTATTGEMYDDAETAGN